MKCSGLKGVVFDFDGVLTLTEPVHYAAFERPARERGLTMPEGCFERMIGRTDSACAKELAEFWKFRFSADEILDWKRERYRSIAVDEAQPTPGVQELLQYLFENEIPAAIATSSHRADILPVIEKMGWTEHFRALHTVEDIKKPKPDPEIYIRAIASLGIRAEDTLVFEDSPVGAAAGRASGASIICLLTSFPKESLGPALDYWRDFTGRGWQGLFLRR